MKDQAVQNTSNNLLILFRMLKVKKVLGQKMVIPAHILYHEILKQNTELMDTIKNVAKNDSQIIIEQYEPRSMQNVKKAADGILFNLGPNVQLTITQQKPLVMLSYSHVNNEFCDRIL